MQFPSVVVALAVLVGYTLLDVIFDVAAKNTKATQGFVAQLQLHHLRIVVTCIF